MRKFFIKTFLFLGILLCLSSVCNAQFVSNYEAKNYLKKLGFTNFIENAEILIIGDGQIEGKGGITVDLPILAFIFESDVRIMKNCLVTTGYINGKMVIKSDVLYISCAYGVINGQKIFIVCKDLKDLANQIYNSIN